ncbi:hypothetical protein IWQ62_004876 [Dispira parvispora]|uniref:Protein PNS1 n=1 Tax=Dispira parvispora TaxID=1520584 RepID=A0A9W8E1K3_9FUNG|nr:hypothetical protein IWQ62_004876 [Dispira parvispora]
MDGSTPHSDKTCPELPLQGPSTGDPPLLATVLPGQLPINPITTRTLRSFTQALPSPSPPPQPHITVADGEPSALRLVPILHSLTLPDNQSPPESGDRIVTTEPGPSHDIRPLISRDTPENGHKDEDLVSPSFPHSNSQDADRLVRTSSFSLDLEQGFPPIDEPGDSESDGLSDHDDRERGLLSRHSRRRVTAPPVQSEASHFSRLGRTHRYFDEYFFQMYQLCLGFFLIMGLYLCLTTSSDSPSAGMDGVLFRNFKQVIALILALIVVTTLMGILWVTFLRYYSATLLWITLLTVPLLSFLSSFWILSHALALPSTDSTSTMYTGYLVGAFLSFGMGVLQTIYMARKREQIHRAMRAVQLACTVLAAHPELFALALLVLSGYVFFVVFWLIFFSRLTLMVPTLPDHPVTLSAPVVLMGLYFFFMFTWTTGIFTNILRLTITLVTTQWYFFRQEDSRLGMTHTTPAAFHLVTRQFMGSVCLGGLLLALAQGIGTVSHVLLFLLRPLRIFPLTLVVFFLRGMERITQTLSNFSMVYVGVTGKGFLRSALAVTRLMKRNYVFSVRSAFILGNLMSITSTALAIVTGWALSIVSLSDLHMQYPYLSGVFGTAIAWVIFQFFGHILVNTVEATLVCYAIDLDTKRNHSEEARRAFADS